MRIPLGRRHFSLTGWMTILINNFCFNALSLGCALRERVISASVVEEVISDLDIRKHLTEMPAQAQLDPEFVMANRNSAPSHGISHDASDDPLTSAQAKAYMQQLAGQLKNWKPNLD